MDATLSIKPALVPAATEPARPAVSAPRAAPTELPTAKTVTAVSQSSAVRNEPRQPARPVKSELVLDPKTNQVIYRVLDAETRRVVWQAPEAATLRLRAYARAAEGHATRPRRPNTSVEA